MKESEKRKTIYYFAYGSNMCLGRLRKRTPSCKFITTAKLEGYDLRFHKESRDGSGKADAYRTDNPDDKIWGVVFEISDLEKSKLDKAEGLGHGYNECVIEELNACMYCADEGAINEELKPYTWYKRFVVEGAKQHKLPLSHIQKIKEVEAIEDPDTCRNRENQEISCN